MPAPSVTSGGYTLPIQTGLATFNDGSGNPSVVTPTNGIPTAIVGTAPGTPASTASTVQGIGYGSSATFTRPNNTNPYDALDVVSDSTSAPTVLTFANIGPSGGGKVILTLLSLEIDVSAIPSGMGAFRLHLYSSAPTAINDAAAFDLPSGDRAKYLGFIETPTPYDLGATLWSCTEDMGFPIRKLVTLASSTAYGILQTVNGYTPTAQAVKKVSLNSVGV